MPIRRLEDTFTGTSATIGADELTSTALASVEHVKPHIQPGVLQPAVAGKLLNGATHSGAYGTAQTQSGGDGHSYYYTDIKGSKPIKDPRIGAHFGSQRHRFSSIQQLEEETATQGHLVFSIDGRDWARAVSPDSNSGTYKLVQKNDGQGLQIQLGRSSDHFVEITGYFSDMNWIQYTASNRYVERSIDGGSMSTANYGNVTAGTPLAGRFVNAGSVINLALGATLGIHTVKILEDGSDDVLFFGVDLIAQDTTSTATKSQIQIPSQNVVSYGKKFTVSGTPHYNPFAFAGDGTTAVAIGNTTSHGKVADGWTGSTATYFDSTLDTATSLGLSAWETGGDFYRPVNGGRVVKWVDSSGTIKTSVNMMPPACRAVGSHSGSNSPTGTAWTTAYAPVIETGTIDHSLAELAKVYFHREFGNGAANQGNNTSGTLQDFSMFAGSDSFSYVMDDGITSLTANRCEQAGSGGANAYAFVFSYGDSFWTSTFIGTGFGFRAKTSSGDVTHQIVQNLPYGSHVYQMFGGSGSYYIYIDGVNMGAYRPASDNTDSSPWELFFYQPKMPPIPENAVVLADYMLMADFVPQTDGGGGSSPTNVSKGCRAVNVSRDFLHDATNGAIGYQGANPQDRRSGLGIDYTNFTDPQGPQLTYFGDAKIVASFTGAYTDSVAKITHNFDGATTDVVVQSEYTDSTAHTTGLPVSVAGKTYYIYARKTSGTMGVQTAKSLGDEEGNTSRDFLYPDDFQVATPIHTSSHYQSFETPFLHELVGGDRNMEQTNLVVTADGKTWDEVTRDTSYLGNVCVRTNHNNHGNADTYIGIFDEWRGQAYGLAGRNGYGNKDFAIAYDRFICLKTGHYRVYAQTKAQGNNNGLYCAWLINGTESARTVVHNNSSDGSVENNASSQAQFYLKRGDYLQLKGRWYNGMSAGTLLIERTQN